MLLCLKPSLVLSPDWPQSRVAPGRAAGPSLPRYLLSARSVLFPTSMMMTSLPRSVLTSSIHLEVCWKEFKSAGKNETAKLRMKLLHERENASLVLRCFSKPPPPHINDFPPRRKNKEGGKTFLILMTFLQNLWL